MEGVSCAPPTPAKNAVMNALVQVVFLDALRVSLVCVSALASPESQVGLWKITLHPSANSIPGK